MHDAVVSAMLRLNPSHDVTLQQVCLPNFYKNCKVLNG